MSKNDTIEDHNRDHHWYDYPTSKAKLIAENSSKFLSKAKSQAQVAIQRQKELIQNYPMNMDTKAKNEEVGRNSSSDQCAKVRKKNDYSEDTNSSDFMKIVKRKENRKLVIKGALASQVPIPCVHCNSIMMLSFCMHPYFHMNRVCSSHPITSVRKCMGCTRYLSCKEKNSLIIGNDDRYAMCGACARTAIVSNEEGRNLYKDVLKFMENEGLDIFDWSKMQQVPIEIVEFQTLNRNNSYGFFACEDDNPMNNSHKLGLTIWAEGHLPIPDVVEVANRASKAVRRMISTKKKSKNSTGNADKNKPSVKRDIWGGMRRAKVRNILCLKGLPRNKMACILAHEATHAWFAYNPLRRDGVVGEKKTLGKIRKLSKTVEEGTCQLVAYLYLKTLSVPYQKKTAWYKFNKKDGPSNQRLNDYFQWEIENDPSPIYGDGFRLAKKAYLRVVESGGGLKEFLEYIVIHLDFPSLDNFDIHNK